MPKHLFLFTIGPVQSFIAQARKTQDLYAGSRLLSELIKTAIDTVGRDAIIFPHAPITQNVWQKVASLPNRFVAELDLSNADLLDKGREVENAVRAEWRKIASTTLAGIHKEPHGFNEQIEQHLDIFWVFEPITEGGYAEAFAAIEKKLGAIKNIRPFTQFAYGAALGEQGRKCSLDGQRNIKFYRKSEKQDKLHKLTDVIVKERFLFSKNGDARVLSYDDTWLKISELQPGEGLSAVSFVKRRYLATASEFESTAEIALFDWIDALPKEELKAYKKVFTEFNEQLYFDENLTDDYFKKQGIKLTDNHTLEQVQNRLKSLKGKTSKKQSKYYAALAFDGDNMGKWLSGHVELVKENIDLKVFHKAFAERLAVFSIEAKDYLDGQHRGRTVYAGGDDFLGFINLNSLFDVIKQLRTRFKELVHNELTTFIREGQEISFSAGVCIAHYKEPLSIVLGKAKHMEHMAKDYTNGEKDKLGIVVLRGSGQEHEMVVSLKNNSVQCMEDLTFALRDEVVSNTFIQNFDRQFLNLTELDARTGKRKALLEAKILKTEFNRLIKKDKKADKKADVDKLAEEIWDIFDRGDLENFIKVLNTCNFIHRHLSKA